MYLVYVDLTLWVVLVRYSIGYKNQYIMKPKHCTFTIFLSQSIGLYVQENLQKGVVKFQSRLS